MDHKKDIACNRILCSYKKKKTREAINQYGEIEGILLSLKRKARYRAVGFVLNRLRGICVYIFANTCMEYLRKGAPKAESLDRP